MFENTLVHVTEPVAYETQKKSTTTDQEDYDFESTSKFYPKEPSSLSFSSMDFEETTIEKAVLEENALPLGIDSGVFIHKILEKIFSDQSKELTQEVIEPIVEKALFLTPYAPYKDYIFQKINFVLDLKISIHLIVWLNPLFLFLGMDSV
jgi:hypothetical protein